ncbi:MAG: globin, partial [Actinomycetota bacterium]|nr:globin [Actinomycetota bacterium]
MTDSRVSGSAEPAPTLFEAVGGVDFFVALVDHFYAGVEGDPVLRPLYPPDLSASKAHLAGFLAQYWGGGTAFYSDARGHPRLRMRHAGFRVGAAERDAWLTHMTAAVTACLLPADLEWSLL